MLRGFFTSTYYIPEAPDVIFDNLDLQLTQAEQDIVDDIMATETLMRLDIEFGAVGKGLV